MSHVLPSCRLDFKSFRDMHGHHPLQTVIFYDNGCLWWIRVAVDWDLPDPVLNLRYLKRRSTLHNTVTNIALTLDTQPQNPIPIRDEFRTSENYFITYWGLRQFKASHLQVVDDSFAATVSLVQVEQGNFVFKSIDCPLYIHGDAEHVLDEIDALSQFIGHPDIAQLVGLVISENPYHTHPLTDIPLVIAGFLLEYYPGGSLAQIIARNEIPDERLLVQWAIQVGTALDALHRNGRTHVDFKPENIVLDSQNNAILIDIGGTGGFGLEWLSPELTAPLEENLENVPTKAPFEQRVGTDCWAYGKVLSILAEGSGTLGGAERLRSIACRLMETVPEGRIPLGRALEEMRDTKSLVSSSHIAVDDSTY
ncbi:putative serine-threonine protein kinase [Aspergillus californicus]